MPFTPSQRNSFIEAIEDRGWIRRGETIYAPGRILRFHDSYFLDMSPTEMHDVFKRRAERIEEVKFGDNWEAHAQESHDVHLTLSELGWSKRA